MIAAGRLGWKKRERERQTERVVRRVEVNTYQDFKKLEGRSGTTWSGGGRGEEEYDW